MKKVLVLMLSLCLLASLCAAFALSVSAEEAVDVTVGMSFEWNDQSGDPASQEACRTGKGKSPDGLWQYMFYSLEKKVYGTMVFTTDFYAWSITPGDTKLGFARARNYGANFHPGETADIVKVFTVPSGGTVTVDSTVARQYDWVADSGNTPSSFAVYLDDQLVYPTSGASYETLVSATPQNITFDLDVKANQRIYFHIGCVDGHQAGDGVDMSNTITYKSVNDEVGEDLGPVTLEKPTVITNTVPLDDLTDKTTDGNKVSNNPGIASAEESSSVGLIIGIVAAVVVVIGVVVAVIVIKKKKA